jgi:hypothetical protein
MRSGFVAAGRRRLEQEFSEAVIIDRYRELYAQAADWA